MKKSKLLLPLVLCQFAFSQVGVNTSEPTKTLDINGDLRIRDIPLATDPVSMDFLVKDEEGNVSHVPSTFFNQSVSGVLNNIVYLQGTTPITVNVGSTANVPGLEFNYTVKKGEKKVLLFTINGAVRAYNSGSNLGGTGQGVFGLYDETNAKITSGYANFSDISDGSNKLLNTPFPISFQKQVILDNTTGTSDLNKTYIVKYTSWATYTTNSNKAHIVNFDPFGFSGYENDTEALLSKLTVFIFNMN